MKKTFEVRSPHFKTVEMSISEFLNWEIIAFKQKWTYVIKGAIAYVTAPIWVLQSYGYELE